MLLRRLPQRNQNCIFTKFFPRGNLSLTLSLTITYDKKVGPTRMQVMQLKHSLAGVRFQRAALQALAREGLPPGRILSLQPIAAFPRSRELWLSGGTLSAGDGLTAELLPTVNLQPLKSLIAGLQVFFRILGWVFTAIA